MKISISISHRRCASVFVSFATLHFGFKELDVLFGDVLTHLNNEGNHLKNTSKDEILLEQEDRNVTDDLASKNVRYASDLMEIIRVGIFGRNKEIWNPIQALANCNNLMPLFEHLHGNNKVSLAKETLENICSQKKPRAANQMSEEDIVNDKFCEALSVNALIYLCSILSDSVDALTIEGIKTINS